MLKRKITYIDFNDNERSEDFYFNLTPAEVLELEMTTTGGLSATLQKIVDEQDTKQIVEMFKKIILQAYGEKSPDGKRFIKSEELSTAFSQTGAYSNLFMELSTDAEVASQFINGIIPKNK